MDLFPYDIVCHDMLHTRSHWLVAQIFIRLKVMIYVQVLFLKGKGKRVPFFSDLSQLLTRGRNPTMLFYFFMPITTSWFYDLLDWMDGWMDDSLKSLECRHLL
jgi:hypothetical protein